MEMDPLKALLICVPALLRSEAVPALVVLHVSVVAVPALMVVSAAESVHVGGLTATVAEQVFVDPAVFVTCIVYVESVVGDAE